MKYRHEKQAEPLIKELCRKEEGIMHAEKALSKVDRDYAKAIRRMNIIIGSMDRASEIYNARLEGKAEGKAEGKEEGKAEGKEEGIAEANLATARKMKKAGKPFSEIAEFTGLPIKTVKGL